MAPAQTCRLPLGPLPPLEAAHFLRQHPLLSQWLFSANPDDRQRAHRLLAASRFHPLLMDRLVRLVLASSLERMFDYIMNIGELTINLSHATRPAEKA